MLEMIIWCLLISCLATLPKSTFDLPFRRWCLLLTGHASACTQLVSRPELQRPPASRPPEPHNHHSAVLIPLSNHLPNSAYFVGQPRLEKGASPSEFGSYATCHRKHSKTGSFCQISDVQQSSNPKIRSGVYVDQEARRTDGYGEPVSFSHESARLETPTFDTVKGRERRCSLYSISRPIDTLTMRLETLAKGGGACMT